MQVYHRYRISFLPAALNFRLQNISLDSSSLWSANRRPLVGLVLDQLPCDAGHCNFDNGPVESWKNSAVYTLDSSVRADGRLCFGFMHDEVGISDSSDSR